MARVLRMLEKLGLVRGVSDESAAPAAPAAAPVAPTEASAGASQPVVIKVSVAHFGEVEEQSAGPEAFAFDQIYAKAGVVEPEHGFTVYKLIELLEADELRGLDPATRAGVIGGMLRRLPGGPVSVDDIVSDAAQRDQALDAFETFLAARLEGAENKAAEGNQALQDEIDRITAANREAMETNRARVAGERERFESWRARKQAEERRLFEAVQPFVERNPVDIDDPAAPDPAS